VNAPDSNLVEVKAMLTEMAAETEDLKRVVGGSITDVAAGWLTPQYLLAVREQLAALPEGPERFKLLRLAAGDVVALQRGGHSAARLQLDREKLELERQKHQDALARARAEVQKLREPKKEWSEADCRALVDKVDEILGLK
jgi:hypothetical protein